MKKIITTFFVLLGFSNISVAQEVKIEELFKVKNCMACHAIDKKLVGPSFKDISVKYKEDKKALETLSKKIIDGGSGVWGPIPMPANKQVSEAEAKLLVTHILKY